jgi:hypothetical protein
MRILNLIVLTLALSSVAMAAEPNTKTHLSCFVSYSFEDSSKNVHAKVSVPLGSPKKTIADYPIDLAGVPAKLTVFYRPLDGVTTIMLNYDDNRAYLETTGRLNMLEDGYGAYLIVTGVAAAAIIPESHSVIALCELMAE